MDKARATPGPAVASPDARFEALYREHYARVLAYVLRRTTPELAKDVVADTFVVAWRRLDRVPENALPWLLAVARKTLANQRRLAKRQDALLGELKAREGLAARAALVGDDSTLLEVAQAYERLSPREQEVLRLVIWDGLSTKDAAIVIGSSHVACRVRLHRAKRRLAAEVAADRRSGPAVIRRLHSTPESCE